MEKLQQLKHKFESLPVVLPLIFRQVFEDIASVVEDMNIEQLDRGERADGSSLPHYSPVSVRVFGKRPGPMNLHDTGAFWQGITLEVFDDGIELKGRDMKTQMLQLRYGDDIIGLQEGSKERIEGDYLKPETEPRLADYFGT